MLDVVKLYPQYQVINDRRKQSSPVAFERRSGIDRRTQERPGMDTKLTKDLYEIKARVAQLQKTQQNNADKISFSQNAQTAMLNTLNSDTFVKSIKPVAQDITAKTSKNQSQMGSAIGAIACMLGGLLSAPLLGPAGIGIGMGMGVYFGGKALKNIIVSHLK